MPHETNDERFLLTFQARDFDGPELTITAEIVRMDDEQVRNITNDSWKPNGLADLKLTAHLLARDPSIVYFTAMPEYREAFSVNLARASTMARTLRKIERDLTRIEDNFGAPRDFADNLARVAKVLAVRKFGWCEVRGHGWSHESNTYAWGDARTMIWKVEHEIEKFRAEHKVAA